MDIESDESERWEDFFGSSTDLTPSLIGIYDRLTNSYCMKQKKLEEHRKSLTDSQIDEVNEKGEDQDSHVSLESLDEIEEYNRFETLKTPTNSYKSKIPSLSSGTQSKSRNFRILSPNVQRLISNSSTAVEKVDRAHIAGNSARAQHHQDILIHKTTDSTLSVKSYKRIITKQKLSHIPLSKNTCKLTQAGNELVETFETNILSSTESLNSNSIKTPTNIEASSSIDNDKTPTNCYADNFHFDLSRTKAVVEDNSYQLQKPQNSARDSEKSSLIPTSDTFSCELIHKTAQIHTTTSLNGSSVSEVYSTVRSLKTSDNLHNKTLSSLNGNVSEFNENQNDSSTDYSSLSANTSASSTLSSSGDATSHSDVSRSDQSSSIGLLTSLENSLKEDDCCNMSSSTTKSSLGLRKTKSLDASEMKDGQGNKKAVRESYNFYVTLPTTENNNGLSDSLSKLAIDDIDDPNKNIDIDLLSLNKKIIVTSSPSTPSSPLLTYSRAKLLGNKSPTNSLKISRKLSAESLDRLTEMKNKQPVPGGVSSMQTGNISPNGNRKATLILPDIAKLKHRPLSSSSICSTSSSSSSGSDHHITGKLGISYLASVESLADQSESELTGSNCNLTVCERACLEIVDSERSYVEDLGQVIKGYLEDWKERACLKIDQLNVLFSNIQDIYDFNWILLKQLTNSAPDPVKIAKCFIDFRDRFGVYTTYCTSYPEAISLLTSLLQASHTNALLTSTQKILNHTLPLGSYLLKPVQRILKYHLLLDNLRKHCDIEEVSQAHEIMREVARNIDQVKRKLEQQSRVKELSGILDGWLGPKLTVLGELRQEGLLMENITKPRMVFLFQTMLIITKPKEDNRLQFKSYIYRSNLMLREHLPGEPASFNVIPYDDPRNQTKLTAKNRDQKRLWAQNIKSVILEQFNIPSRVKELVYKLGDEEDRTPDKSIWKWNLNTSTPSYLERRNHYRRSEIRNRSKIKRKNMTTSISLEGFNHKKDSDNNSDLVKQQSVDDNLIPSLPKKSNSPTYSSHESLKDKKSCPHSTETPCKCHFVKNELSASLKRSAIKERSKSVPRINLAHHHNGDSDEDCVASTENVAKRSADSSLYKFSTLGRPKNNKPVEVKMYNSKTIPKRIATLKKNRAKKETSKFYTDLNEVEDTVLRITESTDNLAETEKKVMEEQSTVELEEESKEDQKCEVADHEVEEKSDDETHDHEDEHDIEDHTLNETDAKTKKDVEIISELLKERIGLNKIMKKPPKKRSFDNGRIMSSPEPSSLEYFDALPPPPPSHSPPPLEVDEKEKSLSSSDLACKRNLLDALDATETSVISEPIYESLLRNVHVPYKFSPVLNRSKSQQYYTSISKRDSKDKPLPRPESDYVTLVYAENGDLKSIGGTPINHPHKDTTADILRNSDSNINYENIVKGSKTDGESSPSSSPSMSFSSVTDLQKSENFTTKTPAKSLLQRFVNSKGEAVSTSENSLLPRVRKSVENISMGFGRSNKPPERRVSDVTEMCRQSFIHRQGSEAVGERMAHLDYADPKQILPASVNNSSVSLNPQRDSVFSLTSSSDSVCDQKKKIHFMEEQISFEYEENVEACLENDFRDSAVYSDDNEKRHENQDDFMDASIDSAPPLPPPRQQQPPPPPRRPNSLVKNNIPPPIPAKPNFGLKRLVSAPANMSEKLDEVTRINLAEANYAQKSWVHQQIQNFNK